MKRKLCSALLLPISLTSGGLLYTATTNAQQIEEIIITARKREESLQSVPIAVTAIDSEGIREKSIENPYDLITHVPGLVVRQGAATRGSVDYFIRGQGATFGSTSGVITYFSEVPIKGVGVAGTNIQFYDFADMQVLKGPQGTLFGRSSTGGAVLFNPQKPTDEFGGYLDTKFGNMDMFETSGALNIPIWEDKLAIRAAFNVQRRDGFTKSISTGEEQDDRHRESYRLGVNFKPVDWFENYTLFQTNNIDESTTGIALTYWNPNYPLLRDDVTIQPLTGFTPAEIGAFFAQPFITGADTVQQLCYGIAFQGQIGFGDIPGCIGTRTNRISQLRADIAAEVDRHNSGGSIRKNVTAGDNYKKGRDQQIINITTLNVGDVGFLGDITFKNILGLHRNRKSSIIREFGASRFPHGVVINNHDLAGMPQRPVVLKSDEETDFDDDVVHEFQVLGDIDGKHSWILGYFKEKVEGQFGPPPVFLTFNNAFTVPLDSYNFLFANTSKTETIQTGYFTQGTFDLSDWLLEGLSVTAGFRWTESESTQDTYALIPGVDGRSIGNFTRTLEFEEDAKSWTFSLDYQVNPDTLVYFAHRRGFKPGGINGTSAAANVPGTVDQYAPETLDDIEFGLKADWEAMGLPVRSNVAVYKSWQNDVQRSETIPTGNGGVVTQINNIAEAEITGLEMEHQLVLNEYVQFLLNYAWTDAEYKQWPGTLTNVNGNEVAYIDSPFVGVPKNQGTLGVRLTLPMDEALGRITFYGEYYRQSGMWLDDSAIFILPEKQGYQSGYDNVNLRVDWSNVLGYPVDAGIFARNLLDDEWIIGSNNIVEALGFYSETYNEPRTYGFQIRYRFGADGG